MERKSETLSRRAFIGGGVSASLLLAVEGCTHDPIDEVLREARLRCESGLQSPQQPVRLKFVSQETAKDHELLAFEYGTDLQNVDYHRGILAAHEGQLTAGPETYTISEITSGDIVSQDFRDCIGSVFVGKSRAFGKDIAFLIHADPTKIVGDHQKEFVRDFTRRTQEFLALVEPESIAYTFFGGKYRHETYRQNRDRDDRPTAYDEERLSVLHVRALVLHAQLALSLIPHIMPSALIGPNLNRGATHVRFRTNAAHDGGTRELFVLAEHTPSLGYSLCSLRDYVHHLEVRLPR